MASTMPTRLADELEARGSHYAMAAAERFVAGTPDAEPRFGSTPVKTWAAHYRQRLSELAVALRFGEPGLFRDELRWAYTAFESRSSSLDDLQASLDHLRSVLAGELPEELQALAVEWTSHKIDEIEEDALDLAPPSGPHSAIALEYLEALLDGDRQRACGLVHRAVDDGVSIDEAYERILLTAQRQAGILWHRNDLIVAQEHFITQTTLTLMAQLSKRAPRPDPNGCTVLLGAVGGNPHDTGLRAVGDFMERSGWNVIFVGGDMPIREILLGVEAFAPDLLALSASLAVHLGDIAETIERVHELDDAVRVLVGGRIFSRFPELAQKVGADASAATFAEVIDTAGALVGLEAEVPPS